MGVYGFDSQESWGCFVFEAQIVKVFSKEKPWQTPKARLLSLLKSQASQRLRRGSFWRQQIQLFFTVGRDGLRDALPPQNPGRSFVSDYNAYLRESAYQAIYRDHLRQSALRAGVGPETSPPTREGSWRMCFLLGDYMCFKSRGVERDRPWQLGTFS